MLHRLQYRQEMNFHCDNSKTWTVLLKQARKGCLLQGSNGMLSVPMVSLACVTWFIPGPELHTSSMEWTMDLKNNPIIGKEILPGDQLEQLLFG